MLSMDNFFIFYNNIEAAKLLKLELHKQFSTNRAENKLKISQDQFVLKILRIFEIDDY